MSRLWILTTLLVLVEGGCTSTSNPEATVAEAPLSVRALDGVLELRNTTSLRLHYAAAEATTAARLDLYFNPEEWTALAPGSQIRIAYQQLMGYTPTATDAVIYWSTALGFGNLRVELR